jgi:hypothetical protein
MKKIKILKDTPFHKKGDEIKVKEFRRFYTAVCSNNTDDDELLAFLTRERSNYILKKEDCTLGEWFQVNSEPEVFPPLAFIHEDMYYTKELDGMYHGWTSPSEKALGTNCKRTMSIGTAEHMIRSAQYKQEILYCTNNVNKKL